MSYTSTYISDSSVDIQVVCVLLGVYVCFRNMQAMLTHLERHQGRKIPSSTSHEDLEEEDGVVNPEDRDSVKDDAVQSEHERDDGGLQASVLFRACCLIRFLLIVILILLLAQSWEMQMLHQILHVASLAIFAKYSEVDRSVTRLV